MRAVIAVALLGLARPALANECNSYGAHTSTADVPLGCPLELAVSADFDPPNAPYQPHVYVTRYDPQSGQSMQIDVTGAVTRGAQATLPVDILSYDGTCELHDNGFEPVPYDMFEIALVGVQVGDQLAAGSSDTAVHVVAAGPCPPFSAPQLSCADPIMTCADAGVGSDPVMPPGTHPPGGGCSAGGSPGIALVLLALLLRRRA